MTKGRTVPTAAMALPSIVLQNTISDAVHRAIVEVTQSSGIGLCSLYAHAGAIVAHRMIGAVPGVQGGEYGVNAGSAHIQVSSEYVFQMRADIPETRGREFHVWFGRIHHGNRVELVDLTARHYTAWAERMGIPVEIEYPAFLWGRMETFPPRVRLVPDVEITQLVRRAIAKPEHHKLLVAVVHTAVKHM